MSAGRWLTQQRVEPARQLPESTDPSVDVIATKAGSGTGASTRRHLQVALGVPPTAYRRTFQPSEQS